MTDSSQNFPNINTQVTDGTGRLTTPWYYLFRSLWNRTGGGSGGSPIVTFPVSVPLGGTGATSASGARQNLGAIGQNLSELYGVTGGLSNAQTLTLVPSISGYQDGERFFAKIGPGPNAGAVTLNVNDKGARAVTDIYGNGLLGGELQAGALAEFAPLGGNLVLLQTVHWLGDNFVWTRAGTGTNIDFNGLPTGFARFQLNVSGLQPAVANDNLLLRVFQASVVVATATYANENENLTGGVNTPASSVGDAFLQIGGACGNGGGQTWNGQAYIPQPEATVRKVITHGIGSLNSGGALLWHTGAGMQDSNTAVNGIRLLCSTGGFNSRGFASLVGLRVA